MCSQDLLRLITRNSNAFLRRNHSITLTTDVFSASAVPMARDLGFLKANVVGLTGTSGNEVTVTRVTRKRRVCKNKKRRGTVSTIYTTESVDSSKVGRKCALHNRKANLLRAVVQRRTRLEKN